MFVVKDCYENLHGPFSTASDAVEWGKKNYQFLPHGYWVIVALRSLDIVNKDYD